MASQDTQPFHWHYSEFDDQNFQIRGRTLFFILAVFSIIILTSLIFLYLRWICHHHDHHHRPSAPPTANAPPQRPPQGLDPTAINSFPIIFHRPSTTTTTIGESECCICLGVFQDGEKVKILPDCHHCYHSECVDKWLTAQSNCPLCRATLRLDSAV